MARLWTSGFEIGQIYEWTSSGGSLVAQTDIARSGQWGVRFPTGLSGNRFRLVHSFVSPANNGPYFFRACLYMENLPGGETRFLAITNGATFLAFITVDTDGLLRLYDEDGQIGSASSPLATGVFHTIELEFDRTGSAGAHVIRARVGLSEFAGAANRSISLGVTQFWVGINLNNEALDGGDFIYDDCAQNDSAGSVQNSYCGEENNIYLRPNGDGTLGLDWTGSWQDIDETPPNQATDVISSKTLNQVESSVLTDSGLSADDTILYVQVGMQFGGGASSANSTFAVGIADSAENQEYSANLVPPDQFWHTNTIGNSRYNPLTLYDLPGASGDPWTPAELDVSQLLAKITVANTNIARITAMWLIVGYIPAVVPPSAGPGSPFLPRKDADSGYHCFVQQFVKNLLLGGEPMRLPDGTIW